MKKIIFLLFSVFQIATSLAQSFGENNAVWHYDIYNPWMPGHFPSILSSSPSNIINGITYYTISYTNSPFVCSANSSYTVYESNDSVYYFLPASNRYAMLYNFNALPGDTEIIYGNTLTGGEDSVMMKIDSVTIININGFNKRVFYTSYAMFSPYFYFEGTIVEDIGSTFFLFPQYTFCDPFHGPLRCYEDTIIGLYQSLQPSINCDTIIYLGAKELDFIPNILISPNPTTDFITIHYNLSSPKESLRTQKETTVSLFNLYGQPLTPKGELLRTKEQEIKIDIRNFAAGVYFVKMNVGGKEEVRKVVKY